MLRATNNSVAGTFSRSASSTALRPETISPLPRSLRPRSLRAALARGEVDRVVAGRASLVRRVVVTLSPFFSAAFLRFAAA